MKYEIKKPEKKFPFLIYFIILFTAMSGCYCIYAQIINEIYSRCSNDIYCNQWIEIFNNSGSDMIVTNYQLRRPPSADGIEYEGANIIPWALGSEVTNLNSALGRSDLILTNFILPQGGYGIVLDRGYYNHEKTDSGTLMDNFSFPAGAIIFTTSLAGVVSSYTIGETNIFLCSVSGSVVIDYFGGISNTIRKVSFGETGGISLERIFSSMPDSDGNWGFCTVSGGQTAGYINSLSVNYTLLEQSKKLSFNHYNADTVFAKNHVGIPIPMNIFALTSGGKTDYNYNSRVELYFTRPHEINTGGLSGSVKKEFSVSFDLLRGTSGVFGFIPISAGRTQLFLTNELGL
ncbi:MAG TPA: hypothetical protein DC049_20005, partial [Spirochaetia bacterium]|nr:hypothetical protein [Spirochaetia bacterium]